MSNIASGLNTNDMHIGSLPSNEEIAQPPTQSGNTDIVPSSSKVNTVTIFGKSIGKSYVYIIGIILLLIIIYFVYKWYTNKNKKQETNEEESNNENDSQFRNEPMQQLDFQSPPEINNNEQQ